MSTLVISREIPDRLVYAMQVIALTLTYFVSARVGFLLPFEGELATLLWPASAVGLAAMLLYGLQLWPAIALGSLLVAISNGHSPQLTAGIIVAHTLEVTIPALILRRYTDFSTSLTAFRDVFHLLVYCIIVGPAIGATLGILSFSMSPEGSGIRFALLWWHWWIAHAITLSVLVPLLLTWSDPVKRPHNIWHWLEWAVVQGGLLLVVLTIFYDIPGMPLTNLPLGHTVFPFLLWIALRFTPRAVATAGFITVLIAVRGTVLGMGPFSSPNLDANLVLLGTFAFSVVIVMLMLASLFSQRAHALAELRASHEVLEARVVERTAALAVARDQALDALAAQERLLANVSHDARTPLSIILLQVEMLRRTNQGMDKRSLHRLSKIEYNVEDLMAFINNLLDAAQMDAHNAAPTHSAVHLSRFLETQAERYHELAAADGLLFQTTLDAALPPSVTSDVDWLDTIVRNLVTNAIKFTEEGHVRLALRHNRDACCWTLSVEDTGQGIPPEEQAKIFKAFWQGDGQTSKRGVGLGLSIVQQFAERLGGRVTLVSEVGRGSAFTVHLPLTPPDGI